MLRNTFSHVPGLGSTTEFALWQSGCHDWDDLLSQRDRFSYGQADRGDVQLFIEKSRDALEARNHQFFRKALGVRDAWRAFPDFRDNCVYLDIETDGGSGSESITTIGLYDGETYTCLVQGEDLENFRDIISHYSMIVTFFGTGFDLPVLQKQFRGIDFDQIHLDLCPTLKRIGMRGGLKSIEKVLGIERSPETVGLTGYDAVKLWRRYSHLRDDAALERLIAYNREDVVNLKQIAEWAYKRMRGQTFEHALKPNEPSLFDELPTIEMLEAPPWDEDKSKDIVWRGPQRRVSTRR